MILNLEAYDFINATLVRARAEERLDKKAVDKSNLAKYDILCNFMREYNFESILKKAKELKLDTVTAMVVCHVIPSIHRATHSTIQKQVVTSLFSNFKTKLEPADFGFLDTGDKTCYTIDPNFNDASSASFRLDKTRMDKLTSVVKFLEHQTYDIPKNTESGK